ncbi:MAG: bifunctional DNA-formamidopyrimidine glycosylase/DNA-(apurinic or apyrimidinic site) lyase [Dehalococcoidia bacterium]|nr:bifunctional DNA-formamidopyrimidine glycosylase/DNA-(apurinic or apyrimidinic site) lyase [Dehalococcoidia bacterium]
MPELPEVETIKNQLMPLVVGRRIQSVEFLWTKTLLAPSIAEFDQAIRDRVIEGVDRRGKYLILRLDSANVLLVHMRMTGSFLVSNGNEPPSRHTRVVVYLDNGLRMFFVDPRKFGKFQLVSEDNSPLSRLGMEPMTGAFTAQRLSAVMTGRKIPVKVLLVDQSILAGIGNMYADEALFEALIHPLRSADSLSEQEIARLRGAIISVLTKAIESGGASVSNYFHPDGLKGKAQESFKVAHRKGENCIICRTPIERIVVRQRGTYFCPNCQRRIRH